MDEAEVLYQAIGRRIRERRLRSAQRLSQAKLAERLGISRVSVVNIEAGRQHAPLHLLWQIAEILDVELVMLIPRRDELNPPSCAIELNEEFREIIERNSNGDPIREKSLTGLVSSLLTTLEAPSMRDEP